jgi:quinol-cytochrome oxidoreductase complex cytochrome b subunit
MKITLKNLSFIAVLSFTLSFVTGMSATIMYQEHQSLQAFMATEMIVDDLIANHDTENFNF